MNILKTEKPKTIANILNGKQTILVMKKVPKNGESHWWYLYCNKSNTQYLVGSKTQKCEIITKSVDARFSPNIDKYTGNGKVVARFWCDKVEEIKPEIWTPKLEQEILKGSCLTENELFNYISKNNGEQDNPFFAIHISKLEIFDKPKELGKFEYYGPTKVKRLWVRGHLTKAPQNYCYIEGE